MKGKVPPTVIKLPIGVTESSAFPRIRLRNNIRLDLPPDRASLLQSRSLCFLLLLYLSYSMYLHYVLYIHVACQDATNRRVSVEIEKLNRRQPNAMSVIDLEHVDDLKQSLQTFINTFKSKSHKEEDVKHNEEVNSSYNVRLSNRGEQQQVDSNIRPVDDIEMNEVAMHLLESYEAMMPNYTHQIITIASNRNDTKYEVSEESRKVFNTAADDDRITQTSEGEVLLVLPKSKVGVDSKHRRARDVVSRASEEPSQSKVSILLKGAAPTASIRDGGVIRPWYLDAQANGNSHTDLSGHFVLQELNGKVQIMKSGLYMVYAQIYYTSSDEHLTNSSESINSYSVSVAGSSRSERPLAVCSVHASVTLTSEVSCHLSIVYHLNGGDRVYLVQREPNRKILLKEGYSYFGLSTLRLDAT